MREFLLFNQLPTEKRDLDFASSIQYLHKNERFSAFNYICIYDLLLLEYLEF